MMNDLDKAEKILIVTLEIYVAAMLLLSGLGIYASWYTSTHHDYGMKTVRTGDVNWVCLTDRGTTIGCDTVKEHQ